MITGESLPYNEKMKEIPSLDRPSTKMVASFFVQIKVGNGNSFSQYHSHCGRSSGIQSTDSTNGTDVTSGIFVPVVVVRLSLITWLVWFFFLSPGICLNHWKRLLLF